MFNKKIIGTDYLHRWHIIPRNRFFNIYLHHFIGDDNRLELHDHPWNFVSILLKGRLLETFQSEHNQRLHHGWLTSRYIPWLLPRYYHATHRHCFELPSAGPQSAWSLVFTGPRYRNWGFYRDGILIKTMTGESDE